MIKKLLCIVVLGFTLQTYAQERLIELEGNPVLEQIVKSQPGIFSITKSTNDTLELPFFDDFAVITVYPDQARWIGYDAYVNSTWAMDPISYGVASLDMADSIGQIRSLSTAGELSEMLTSRPINLEYPASDSIILSFAWQRGGNARKPEEQDSLVLMFNSPDTTWHSVWSMEGGVSDTAFHNELIPIREDYLLKKGFQFRFVNYASNVVNAPEPSFNSNNDIWNLDYVWLDTERSVNDTIINDIAMMYNFSSLLTGFESVPWKHYLAKQVVSDSLVYVYRSNGENGQAVNRQFEIIDEWGNGVGISDNDDSENIIEFQTLRYAKPVPFEFDSDLTDSARFLIKGYISSDEEADRLPFRWNDTVYYYQNFQNYYAYDDGNPEVGYGIGGVGTSSASVSYEFTPLVGDTLRGVNIYFNRVLNDENQQYFYLMVWDDNDGIPGDTITYQIGARPEFKDSLFQYTYYALDTPVYVSETFHIGWTKTTDDMLNVGFDLNRNASEKAHYNVFGTWEEISFEGALMVRPVFSETPYLSVPEEEVRLPDFDVYPNPASNQIYIDNPNDYDQLQIVSATGRLVYQSNAKTSYNVSSYSEGLYLLLFYKDDAMVGKQKLLIRK